MKTIDIIRQAVDRRNDPASPGPRGTPAWWADLVDELQKSGAALIKAKQLTQFGARFNGMAVIIDSQATSNGEIASFEVRLTTGTDSLYCAALNEPANKQM